MMIAKDGSIETAATAVCDCSGHWWKVCLHLYVSLH